MPLNAEGLLDHPGIMSRKVRLASGAIAHYMTSGETGPAVILLHGGIVGSSGLAGWRFMLPFLGANGFRVYAPDRPGFGFADTRPEHWPSKGWKSYVEFVKEFADALCLDQFYLSGNSMGAQNSIYFMCNYPERVLRSALIATASMADIVGVDPAWKQQFGGGGGGYGRFDGTKESMYNSLVRITYRKEALTDDLLEMRTRAALLQTDSFASAQVNRQLDDNMAQWQNVTKRLPALDIPMIYLQGVLDTPQTVEAARQAEPLLPKIQFFYPEETSHQGQTDQPDLFNQAFLEFFRDGKVSRASADALGISKNRPELPNLVEQAAAVSA
jgi:pimeloyl-ACP methyl ester carboxylesterase